MDSVFNFTVEIGGVMFRVAKREDLQRLCEGWPEPCYRNIPLTPLGYLLPDDHVAQQILTATGHDWGKIDSALPEDWREEYYRQHGRYPWACWSYEKRGDCVGEAIFMEDVYTRLDHLMKEAVWGRLCEFAACAAG